MMEQIKSFRDQNPEPTWDTLQDFAMSFGRIPRNDLEGIARLRELCVPLKEHFPKYTFYPMTEHPDINTVSICVDDPADWE